MGRLEALARHPLAIAGALITTASAVVFLALVVAILLGLLTNPYAGLVVFIVLPAIFLAGLLLMPVGMHLQHRKEALHPETPTGWPVVDFGVARVRRATLAITALTAVNVVIILLAGYGSLHWMESPTFCGQVCHTPMQPQFTAWRNGPHANIACATCHIGEGAQGFVHAKLSGVRQLLHVATGSYPRPVPPGAEMPPGAQARTCLGCHQPGRNVGNEVRVIREYADDDANTESTTVLLMNVGSAFASTPSIHRHTDPGLRIEYIATDPERQTIPYVKVTRANGEVKEFIATDTKEETVRNGTLQTMDCMDCHNTVGHPIAQTPERAVDRALSMGMVSRSLPYARREAVRILQAPYPSHEAAATAIDSEFRAFYTKQGGAVDPQALARASAALQDVYRSNVFPSMKVTWGTYPTNNGHITSNGCVRCHDDSHQAKDGSFISGDCEYCHKQLDQMP